MNKYLAKTSMAPEINKIPNLWDLITFQIKFIQPRNLLFLIFGLLQFLFFLLLLFLGISKFFFILVSLLKIFLAHSIRRSLVRYLLLIFTGCLPRLSWSLGGFRGLFIVLLLFLLFLLELISVLNLLVTFLAQLRRLVRAFRDKRLSHPLLCILIIYLFFVVHIQITY